MLGLALGCVQIGTFPCERDSQCTLEGREGQCMEPGYCALPDGGCESGYRWHERGVPEDLAGRCAPASPSEGSSSASSDQPSSSSTSGDDASTASETTSTSDSSSSEGGSSSTGSDCGDHPCPCAVSLTTGANHTCVARTDGRVACWGANNWGQLGKLPGEGPIPEPQVVVIPGEALLDVVVATNNGTCGYGSTEAVWCWGENNNGELAAPAARTPDEIGPTLLPLAGLRGALGISSQHTCFGDPMGPGVRCQGSNGFGELGGSGGQPIDGMVPGMAAVDELALGNDHTCARAGDQVWCWGRDNLGQLGSSDASGSSSDPVVVMLPGPASHLAAGNNHTCAAWGDGAGVRCWGRGDLGQVGDGDAVNRFLPQAVDLPAPVVAMQALIDTTCARLDDESLWCWGDDDGGPLGAEGEAGEPMLVPTKVPVIGELPEPIVEFDLGAAHLCARAESGRVWCWGRNTSWQLGPGTPAEGQTAVELDVQCPDR